MRVWGGGADADAGLLMVRHVLCGGKGAFCFVLSWLRSGLAEVFRSDTVLMAERLRCSLSALGYFTYPFPVYHLLYSIKNHP